MQARQTNTAVVVTQPTSVIYQQDVPAWIGSDLLIYFSIFTMLCCGLLPGIVALMLSREVSKCYNKFITMHTGHHFLAKLIYMQHSLLALLVFHGETHFRV